MKQSQQKNKNYKTYLLICMIVFILLLAGLKAYLDLFSSNVNITDTNKEMAIYVRQNQQIEAVFFQIENAGYLKNQASFERLANLAQLESKIKLGKYVLTENMSNFEIIKMLYNGRQLPINVVFKEANKLAEISGFFGSKLIADSAGLNELLLDTAYLNTLGFNSENMLAFFIPNTYNFYWNTDVLTLMARMEKEYKTFWNEERRQLATHLGLNVIEVSTLASIVQKESNKIDEMPIIAGVYLNRLRLNMPLQADPTIIFAWNDNSIKRVTSRHTAIISPYNTYVNLGLPPGPICTPSIQAIDAVLHSKKHQFLYFCAKEDFSGYHVFAENFSQHLQHASKYQRALNRLKIR